MNFILANFFRTRRLVSENKIESKCHFWQVILNPLSAHSISLCSINNRRFRIKRVVKWPHDYVCYPIGYPLVKQKMWNFWYQLSICLGSWVHEIVQKSLGKYIWIARQITLHYKISRIRFISVNYLIAIILSYLCRLDVLYFLHTHKYTVYHIPINLFSLAMNNIHI